MGDKALSSSNFRKAYINGSKEYHLYRHVKEVNALYKVDFGSIEPYKIYELDQIALREKQKNFREDIVNQVILQFLNITENIILLILKQTKWMKSKTKSLQDTKVINLI